MTLIANKTNNPIKDPFLLQAQQSQQSINVVTNMMNETINTISAKKTSINGALSVSVSDFNL